MSNFPVTPLAAAALELAARGLRVFPCRVRSKQPCIKENLKAASTDPDIVARWWREWPYANVAVATGEGSGIWVTDVDGDEGEQALRDLERQHGSLPSTVEVITGDNGRHLYWLWSKVDIRNTGPERVDIPGIHTRGNGGYVMVPPSVHPISGRNYAWSVDSADAFAEAPEWLIELVTKRTSNKPTFTTPEAWCAFLNEPVSGSRRGSAVARLSGLLLRRYIDVLIALDICRLFNALRCEPPLADEEIIDIVAAICGHEKTRRGLP
jgi:hypothetical protein